MQGNRIDTQGGMLTAKEALLLETAASKYLTRLYNSTVEYYSQAMDYLIDQLPKAKRGDILAAMDQELSLAKSRMDQSIALVDNYVREEVAKRGVK